MDVLCDGQSVGHLAIVRRSPGTIEGRFIPGPNFEVCRVQFEDAARLYRQMESSVMTGYDYVADEEWDDLIAALTARISMPEVSEPIWRFGVYDNMSVTVHLSVSTTSGHESPMPTRAANTRFTGSEFIFVVLFFGLTVAARLVFGAWGGLTLLIVGVIGVAIIHKRST